MKGKLARRKQPSSLHRSAAPFLLLFVASVAAMDGAFAQSGLREKTVTVMEYGEPILRFDFERCKPATVLKFFDEASLRTGKARSAGDCWIVRHPSWTEALLNARGNPPDIEYDPRLKGVYDIYLGLRAVHPRMTFGIKLSNERDFTIITAPAAAPKRHFDFEFHWKIKARMDGQKILIRSLGFPIYIQYFRFVPWVAVKRTRLVPVKRVIICKEKGRHFAFPSVTILPNGELAVVCREGEAHICPYGRIVLIRSRDGGETWQKREVIYDSISDDRDPSILSLPGGTVLVTFNTWHSWVRTRGLREKYADRTRAVDSEEGKACRGSWIIFSRDNGRTWSKPVRTPSFSPHGPVLGRDGRLYYVGVVNKFGKRFVVIHRSDDGGKSWTLHSEVAYCPLRRRSEGLPVFDEPNLAIPPKGRWIVSIRVNLDGHVRQSYSGDGRNWSFPIKLPVRGYPQHVLPLKDGRLLMTYGYRFEPPSVRGCISEDGGRSWDLSREIVFREGGDSRDIGYPVSIQMNDGRVFTVYYFADGEDCYIEGAFYRP